MTFDSTYQREELVDGMGPWVWTKNENGAWVGPKGDWENSHKKYILENVKNYRVVLQAGGNQGMYPCLLRRFFDRVYTFEPDYLNFFCLAQNCQDPNIFKFQSFLGEGHGMFPINHSSMDNSGMHTLGTGFGHIPMLMIDDFQFDCLDFIWLDIECSEIGALKGAVRNLEQHKPVVMCENANQEIADFLGRFGYKKIVQSVSDTIFAVV